MIKRRLLPLFPPVGGRRYTDAFKRSTAPTTARRVETGSLLAPAGAPEEPARRSALDGRLGRGPVGGERRDDVAGALKPRAGLALEAAQDGALPAGVELGHDEARGRHRLSETLDRHDGDRAALEGQLA